MKYREIYLGKCPICSGVETKETYLSGTWTVEDKLCSQHTQELLDE